MCRHPDPEPKHWPPELSLTTAPHFLGPISQPRAFPKTGVSPHPHFLIPLLGPGHPTPTPFRTQIQTLRKEQLVEKQRVSIVLRSLIRRGLRWGRFRAGVWVIPLTSIRDDIQVCNNGSVQHLVPPGWIQHGSLSWGKAGLLWASVHSD